jgi:hypothetical protein
MEITNYIRKSKKKFKVTLRRPTECLKGFEEAVGDTPLYVQVLVANSFLPR